MEKKNWIAEATSNRGGLHRALGIPESKKIPAEKLQEARASDNPRIRREAALAITLKRIRNK